MGDVVAGGERYTVGQVLVRLREEFGQEVTADQVHKAVWSPRVANSRASLVAQIPTPVRRDGALFFSAEEIEQWLREHPRRVKQRAMEQLELGVRAALDADDETRLREAVAQARASQLSWAQCAQAFARAGRRVSRQAVAARFG